MRYTKWWEPPGRGRGRRLVNHKFSISTNKFNLFLIFSLEFVLSTKSPILPPFNGEVSQWGLSLTARITWFPTSLSLSSSSSSKSSLLLTLNQARPLSWESPTEVCQTDHRSKDDQSNLLLVLATYSQSHLSNLTLNNTNTPYFSISVC